MVKEFSEQQVDDIIKLKFGSLVSSANNQQYVSNACLGQIFGVSGTKIRQLYTKRFQEIQEKQLSFLQQLQRRRHQQQRKYWGMRFIKKHEIEWLVNDNILRNQTGMSL